MPPSVAGLRRNGTTLDETVVPRTDVSAWRSYPLEHGFFGRRGGVGVGAFASLNLSFDVGDDPLTVSRNWQRVRQRIGPRFRLVKMRQVHGSQVAVVEGGEAFVGEADAMVTNQPGLALVVLTADCVPMLLVAPDHGVVGAVHAGWKGTLAGVASAAVRTIHDRYNVPLHAIEVSLGPSIGVCCYEVGADVGRVFRSLGNVSAAMEGGSGSRIRVDLRLVNAMLLERAGVPVEKIRMVGPCTRCAAADFFSHRGAAGPTGRQASLIAIRP
jgi:YfiH family protein